MSNFIDDLNRISDRQGKERINPMVIEGFGPGFTPPPAMPEKIMSAAELHGEALELPEDDAVIAPQALSASPLLKLGLVAQSAGMLAPVQEADLWVRDGSAGYRGRSVTLSDKEQEAIAKVVLKALRRDLDSLYSERIGTKPRAPRKAKKPASRVRPLAGS